MPASDRRVPRCRVRLPRGADRGQQRHQRHHHRHGHQQPAGRPDAGPDRNKGPDRQQRTRGVVIGKATYGFCRGTVGTSTPAGTCNDDIATLFGSSYRNIAEGSGAIAYFLLDTTTLSEGIHSAKWRIIDSNLNVQEVGSRFFYVQNPVGSPLWAAG